jgi:hypothetical protein
VRGRMRGMDTIPELEALLAEMDKHIAQVGAEPLAPGDIKAQRRLSIRLQELRFNRGLVQWKLTKLVGEEHWRLYGDSLDLDGDSIYLDSLAEN